MMEHWNSFKILTWEHSRRSRKTQTNILFLYLNRLVVLSETEADFIKAGGSGHGHGHVEQSDVVCVDLEELEYPIPSSSATVPGNHHMILFLRSVRPYLFLGERKRAESPFFANL